MYDANMKYTSWEMRHVNQFLFSFSIIAFIGNVIAYPDKYEIQDANTNVKLDLLDLLPENGENEKEYRRESTEDPFENWTGRWMPSRPGEHPFPPKVYSQNANNNTHYNDHIPMGVKSKVCDDGKTNLTVDWDYSSNSYTCFGQQTVPNIEISPEEYCVPIPKHYVAQHLCMNHSIEYEDEIPLFGTHRPIWPVYGEYKYIPTQRWLHSLEHGGIVMLYHPCANPMEVDYLKKLVKGCLRRHIITPYDLPDEERPLALLAWGCRLTMSYVNEKVVRNFIHNYALHAPENQIFRDGDFDDQLIERASIVTDKKDSTLCSKLK